MVRKEIRLTHARMQAVRRLSATTGRSVAELVRDAVDQYIVGNRVLKVEERIERAIAVSGAFASGGAGVSAEHDRYLADAFGQ